MHAIRIVRRVEPTGSIHLDALPFPEGQRVEVILRAIEDDEQDLDTLGESGLEFWRNDIDDQVWNDALPST